MASPFTTILNLGRPHGGGVCKRRYLPDQHYPLNQIELNDGKLQCVVEMLIMKVVVILVICYKILDVVIGVYFLWQVLLNMVLQLE